MAQATHPGDHFLWGPLHPQASELMEDAQTSSYVSPRQTALSPLEGAATLLLDIPALSNFWLMEKLSFIDTEFLETSS
jgi:hypothetical protein